MKKSMLYTGIGYFAFGIACIAVADVFEFQYEALLWGLGGAGVGPGIMMIWRYIHWSKPERRDEFNRRLEMERIAGRDERMVMLRDKSGRITSMIMIAVYCSLMAGFAFCVLGGLFMPFAKYAVTGLSILLLLQIFCGPVVFWYLNKKL